MKPLYVRVAPGSLDQVVGQDHILGPNAPLRRLIASGQLRAAIFFGPPGTGKTLVARIAARELGGEFLSVNAADLTPKDLRAAIRAAEASARTLGAPPLLFVDEIHRFPRNQQELLLAALERGGFRFIGSTVHNPAFALSKALLSRCLLFEFKELSPEDILTVLLRAAEQEGIDCAEELLRKIALASGGDARRALVILEAATVEGRVSKEQVDALLAGVPLRFDRTGDEHYDLISALIKSIRGSDPHAAAYWLVRLLEAGEDPLYILRRLLVHAAEDIGLRDPMALVVAEAAAGAFERVGRPEGDLILMEAVLYLANAPKSNSVLVSLGRARRLIAQGKVYPVPSHLRDSHYSLAKKLGRGVGYKYPHTHPDADQDYLPPELVGEEIYPGEKED